MPLPPPDCAREASHQRSIIINAYARADGLWDIEGHLTHAWTLAGAHVPAACCHRDNRCIWMWLRLTVDSIGATIVAVQADTDAGPYDKACRRLITPDYGQLVGVRVARGYRDAIRRLFGRTAGCTHMNELAGGMGSAALQAMWEGG